MNVDMYRQFMQSVACKVSCVLQDGVILCHLCCALSRISCVFLYIE